MLNKFETFISKKLHFDAKYTFRGGFWLLFGHLFTILSVLCTSYVFANYLDPLLYGNYRYLVSAAVIISLFSLSGINTTITQAAAKGINFFSEAVQLSLRYGLLTTMVGLILACYYLFNDNNLLATGFILIAILQPLINAANLIFPYFFGKQQFSLNTFWHAVKMIITAMSVVAAVLLTNNVLIIFLTFLLSNLFSNTLVYWINKPDEKQVKNIALSKQYTDYAKHTSIQNILLGVANQLDKVLVFQFLGAKELAIYAFATALPDQYKGFTKTVDSLLLPRFSKHDARNIKERMLRKSLLYFLFLLFCAASYIIITPFIFQWLYPNYGESIFLSQLYALGIIFGFGDLAFTAMKSELDNRVLYKFKIVLSMFQILSLVILLPIYGLFGAVLSRVLNRGFSCVYGYYLYYTKRQI